MAHFGNAPPLDPSPILSARSPDSGAKSKGPRHPAIPVGMPETGMFNARLCVRLAGARATQSVIPLGLFILELLRNKKNLAVTIVNTNSYKILINFLITYYKIRRYAEFWVYFATTLLLYPSNEIFHLTLLARFRNRLRYPNDTSINGVIACFQSQ
jgi:hypothetical protein